MAILFMTIKKQYFDEILSGKKKEEYRLVMPLVKIIPEVTVVNNCG